jgi:hypothetical protein
MHLSYCINVYSSADAIQYADLLPKFGPRKRYEVVQDVNYVMLLLCQDESAFYICHCECRRESWHVHAVYESALFDSYLSKSHTILRRRCHPNPVPGMRICAHRLYSSSSPLVKWSSWPIHYSHPPSRTIEENWTLVRGSHWNQAERSTWRKPFVRCSEKSEHVKPSHLFDFPQQAFGDSVSLRFRKKPCAWL